MHAFRQSKERPLRREQAAALAYGAAVVAVLAASRAGWFPGTGQAFDGTLLHHPYRLSMAVTGNILAVWLGIVAALIGVRSRNWAWGLAALVAGGFATGVALAFAPSVLYPGDQYPVTFGWLAAGAPLAGATWLVATLALRRAARLAQPGAA